VSHEKKVSTTSFKKKENVSENAKKKKNFPVLDKRARALEVRNEKKKKAKLNA